MILIKNACLSRSIPSTSVEILMLYTPKNGRILSSANKHAYSLSHGLTLLNHALPSYDVYKFPDMTTRCFMSHHKH